jgi:hypothetical protein
MANIITTSLILPVIILGFFSCSDVTSFSKEQIQENKIMIDGPGSKIITAENQPLYLLNDEVISTNHTWDIKPDLIDSIAVIKGETALRQFGKKGEYGVIKIYVNPEALADIDQ